MMKRILIFLLPAMLTACYDSAEQEKGKNLKCDSFDYRNGLVIYSKNEIKAPVLVIKYKRKDGFLNPLDTTEFDVTQSEVDSKIAYFADNVDRDMNTAYDYKIIVNGTREYQVTDIASKLYTPGGDFMSGTKYMCVIASYKLNDSLVIDEGNIIIRF
jgi:hypothetical protein